MWTEIQHNGKTCEAYEGKLGRYILQDAGGGFALFLAPKASKPRLFTYQSIASGELRATPRADDVPVLWKDIGKAKLCAAAWDMDRWQEYGAPNLPPGPAGLALPKPPGARLDRTEASSAANTKPPRVRVADHGPPKASKASSKKKAAKKVGKKKTAKASSRNVPRELDVEADASFVEPPAVAELREAISERERAERFERLRVLRRKWLKLEKAFTEEHNALLAQRKTLEAKMLALFNTLDDDGEELEVSRAEGAERLDQGFAHHRKHRAVCKQIEEHNRIEKPKVQKAEAAFWQLFDEDKTGQLHLALPPASEPDQVTDEPATAPTPTPKASSSSKGKKKASKKKTGKSRPKAMDDTEQPPEWAAPGARVRVIELPTKPMGTVDDIKLVDSQWFLTVTLDEEIDGNSTVSVFLKACDPW